MTTKDAPNLCEELCRCDGRRQCAHCARHYEDHFGDCRRDCPVDPDHITESDYDEGRFCPQCALERLAARFSDPIYVH